MRSKFLLLVLFTVATAVCATIPETSLSVEYSNNHIKINGRYSLILGVQTENPWLFIGSSLTNIDVTMDKEFIYNYGFDWVGLCSFPFLLGYRLNYPSGNKELSYNSLFFLCLTGFPQLIFNPRIEIALNPFFHITTGYNINTYIWKETATTIKPWVGFLIQTDNDRGIFNKYGGEKNIIFFEATIGKKFCYGTGYLPSLINDTVCFNISSGITF